MADKTGIEWTDATWNPVTGCTEVTPGCDRCYAKTFAERWRGTPGHYFENGFDVQLRPDKLDQPLRWTRPRRIFVNSMSDLFHDQVPDDYIGEVFAVMAAARHHTFQLLTKRHGRMRSLLSSEAFIDSVEGKLYQHADPTRGGNIPTGPWDGPEWWPLPNVWLGVSAEDQKRADLRIPALLDTPAAVRFVSAEPLLGWLELTDDLLYRPMPCPNGCSCSRPMDADANDCACGGPCCMSMEWNNRKPDLDWVIVGGESGHGARPMHPDWARDLRNRCQDSRVAFLFKQWGEFAPGRIVANAAFSGGAYFDGPSSGGNPAVSLPYIHDFGDGVGAHRVGKKSAGREIDGRTWDEYPQDVAHD